MTRHDLRKRWHGVAIALSVCAALPAYGEAMKQPDVKLNPQPRMRYEITATIHGAPGALDVIEGHVDYEVSNPDCVPMTPVMGATVVPQKSVPVTFRRTGDNIYTGEIFLDRLQDEDYFNQGVCHWSVVGVAAAFRHGQVSFSPSIYKKDILGKHDVVKYFSHASYEHAERQRIDIGASDPQAFQSNATFSITMHAAERLP